MICSACGNSNPSDNNFCIHCGTALNPASPRVEADVIAAEVSNLRLEVNALKESLQAHGIELVEPERSGFAASDAASEAAPHVPAEVAQGAGVERTVAMSAGMESAQPAVEDTGETEYREAVTSQGAIAAAPAGPGFFDRFDDIDWDTVIGGNWLVRVGALAVVLGMGFFLKLAFDNEWIGETGRVALGVVAGMGMLGAAEYWRSKYPVYSHALSGAGVAILYLSVFAAFALYQMFGIYPAIGLLVLISITSAALALVRNSIALAVMGIIGGFSAPFILGGAAGGVGSSTPSTTEAVALLVYIAAINVGVITLSPFRNWRWFVLLALLGSLATFGLWVVTYMGFGGIEVAVGPTNAALIAQAGLTSIFLSFVAATTLFHLVWRRRPNALDLSLMFFNGLSFGLISFGILNDEFSEWLGAFALVTALFYAGVGYVALLRIGIAPIDRSKPDYDVLLTYISLGIATVFLTVAIPLQFGGPWVSIAWVVEAMVLLWIGKESRLPDVRRAALVLYGLSLVVMLFFDTPLAIDDAPGLFQNQFAFSYALMAAAAFVTAYMVSRWKDRLTKFDMFLVPAAIVAGFATLAIAVPGQVEGSWMVVSWAGLGLAAVGIGTRIGMIEMRLTGLGVLVIAAIAAIAGASVIERQGYTVLFNSRFLAFGPLIAAAIVSALLWHRWPSERINEKTGRGIVMALIVAANGLALWFLSAEVIGGVQSGVLISVASGDRGDLISLALTALWGSYGAMVLIAGFFGGWRPVRLAGLGLLGVPVVKLFLVDSFQLEAGFRVGAFMIMGIILMSGGYLYQRHNTAFKDFFLDANGQTADAQ